MHAGNAFIPSERLHPPSVWVVLQIEQNLDLWILYFGSCTAQTLSWFLCLLLFKKKFHLIAREWLESKCKLVHLIFPASAQGIVNRAVQSLKGLHLPAQPGWADVVPQPPLHPFHKAFCTENAQTASLPALLGGCHVNIVHFPAWGAWEVLKEAARCGSVASLPVCADHFSSQLPP